MLGSWNGMMKMAKNEGSAPCIVRDRITITLIELARTVEVDLCKSSTTNFAKRSVDLFRVGNIKTFRNLYMR